VDGGEGQVDNVQVRMLAQQSLKDVDEGDGEGRQVHGDVQVGVQAIGKPLLPLHLSTLGRLNDELEGADEDLPDEVTSVQVKTADAIGTDLILLCVVL